MLIRLVVALCIAMPSTAFSASEDELETLREVLRVEELMEG